MLSELIVDKYSIPMTKSNGDIGSPHMTPLSALNSVRGVPLMNREYFIDVSHAMTILVNFLEKLRAINMSHKKSQSRASYAFLRSIFKKQLGEKFFLSYCFTITWQRRMFWRLLLPSTKAP